VLIILAVPAEFAVGGQAERRRPVIGGGMRYATMRQGCNEGPANSKRAVSPDEAARRTRTGCAAPDSDL